METAIATIATAIVGAIFRHFEKRKMKRNFKKQVEKIKESNG